MTEPIHAPWTSEQVAALNAFQQRGGMHPFTCGGEHTPGSPALVAHPDGWHCPEPYGEPCDYRQDWAHPFMADPSAWPAAPTVVSPPAADRAAAPDDTDLTEADVDQMLAAGTPVQIVTAPPATYAMPEPPANRLAILNTPTPDRATPVCRNEEGCHAVVPCDPGCGTRNLLADALSANQRAAADRADLRQQAAARLWTVAEHNIIAEWICCDPINPEHDLCVQGDAARRMVKALLVDDPDAYRPAPLLDAALAVLPEPTNQAAILREAADALPEADLRLVPPMDRKRVADWLRRLADAAPAAGLRGEAGETQQPEERPRCPHCQMPHDLTPDVAAVCASIRASIPADEAQQGEEPTS